METDKVPARLAEAEAPARQKVAPHLLQGLGRQRDNACSRSRPSPSPLVPERLRSGGVAVTESGRARGPEGGWPASQSLLTSPPLVATGCYKYHSCLWMLQEVT